jgi:hypothetical protein
VRQRASIQQFFGFRIQQQRKPETSDFCANFGGLLFVPVEVTQNPQ